MTTENNKLIQKFMNHYENMGNKGLLYHKDWNWLMEVVEKIESLKISVLIGLNNCAIEKYHGNTSLNLGLVKKETKKESVYCACIEFIKWYNEQK